MIIDLKQARIKNGYSIKEASVMVDISENELMRYENIPGKTPVHIYFKLHTLYKNETSN